jgi:hypothetical protein
LLYTKSIPESINWRTNSEYFLHSPHDWAIEVGEHKLVSVEVERRCVLEKYWYPLKLNTFKYLTHRDIEIIEIINNYNNIIIIIINIYWDNI